MLLAVILLGCSPSSSSSDRSSSTTGASSAKVSTTPVATVIASSAPLSSAQPPAPPHPYAGSWSGSFKAVKADVFVPDGVGTQPWSADVGTAATGDGKLAVTIDPTGRISGRCTGSLGSLTVTGMVDGTALRAGLTPVDPLAEPYAMTGYLLGAAKGTDVFLTTLRASSQQAEIVRQAELSLKRE